MTALRALLHHRPLGPLALSALLGVLLSGCAEFRSLPNPLDQVNLKRDPEGASVAAMTAEIEQAEQEMDGMLKDAEVEKGSGRVVGALPRSTKRKPGAGEVMLNFEDTDVQEVAKVVLADLLEVNYIVEPGVSGSVSIQSSRPLGRDELLPVLESLLDINGAALTYDDTTDIYRIAPRTNAVRSAFPPSMQALLDDQRPGFSTEIVPLAYIDVDEMKQILAAFAGDESVIYADARRNLLVLGGTAQMLDRMNDTISLFDVDWMAGMSTGLYPLKFAEPGDIIGELETIMLSEADGTTLVRFTPIERLNAVLVITRQPSYLERAERWIDTLDRESAGESRRLFVYRVKNGLAGDLARVLSNMFGGSGGSGSNVPNANLAPGLQQATATSQPMNNQIGTQTNSQAGNRTLGGGSGNSLSFDTGTIRIIADEINNSLVIMANADEYGMIEQALRELDVMPLQVLIEASIIEITLSDDLSYGLEWFFKNQGPTGNSGQGLLDLGDPGLASLSPGFSYALLDGAGAVQAVLNMLANQSQVNVLSSPTVMVLGNQTATINVGDQVPIASRQSISNVNPGAPTVNEIEYRDTGVILTVTPRVNPGGLITMQISQEVSDAALTTSSGIDAPTIQQRNIESTVAIQSGNTVILGGLIRDRATEADSGVPGLYDIPVVGALFGSTSKTNSRTELIVLITPRAVTNAQQALDVTDEFRTKLRGLAPKEAEAAAGTEAVSAAAP